MVDIVQLVERQFVALDVVGSSPTIHPSTFIYIGLSPSGKALDFDSSMRWFESSQPSQKIKIDCKFLLAIYFFYLNIIN